MRLLAERFVGLHYQIRLKRCSQSALVQCGGVGRFELTRFGPLQWCMVVELARGGICAGGSIGQTLVGSGGLTGMGGLRGNGVKFRDALLQFSSHGAGFESCSGVEECVELICLAVGAGMEDGEFTISGTQNMLGMDGQWRLKWHDDSGRFWEQFDGAEMTVEWGYDGINEPWVVDATGRCSILELDDREVCLLTSWIRTGFWVTRNGQKQLDIRLEQGDVVGTDRVSSSEFMLSIRLKDGKVVAYVVVDSETMFPLRTSIKAFGGWGKWQFSDWQLVGAGRRHLFAYSSIHTQASGNKEVYLVRSCPGERDNEVQVEGGQPFFYSLPRFPVVYRPQTNYPRVDLDSTSLPSVQMLRGESGHYLVQPLVNGKSIGYFIVDTGSSCLIIVPQKVKELDLVTFGEVHVTGANGEVKSRYCRAQSFQLGQLRIQNPVFMEVPISGLVGGDPFVVGMCGFDIFAHCIVEMAYDEGRLSLFDPAVYKPSYTESFQWHELRFIESLPHALATFNGHTALFLLDTGAGGADVIFHGRAVHEFDLLRCVHAKTSAELLGIKESGKGLEVTLGVLDELSVAGLQFKKVNALLFLENGGKLDTSEYVAGLIGGDLLYKCRVVLNYAQRQYAVFKVQNNC